MPKKVNHGPYEVEIKKLLGLPSWVSILQLQTYEKTYYSQKWGERVYYYCRINYYDPVEGKVFRKHIREKDKERKAQILALWRLEQKHRKEEPLGAFDRDLQKALKFSP